MPVFRPKRAKNKASDKAVAVSNAVFTLKILQISGIARFLLE